MRYIEQRNLVKNLVDSTKMEYYTNYVNKNSDKPQTLWSAVNTLLYRKNSPILPNSDNLPDKFVNYFHKKIEDIRESFLMKCRKKECTINDGITLNDFNPVSNDEVLNIIKKIKNKSSPHDPIPTFLLKAISAQVTPMICIIANYSFISSCIPPSEKRAVITPIIKKH